MVRSYSEIAWQVQAETRRFPGPLKMARQAPSKSAVVSHSPSISRLILLSIRSYTRQPMNVHYLELFYYVAKHEGITQAVRKMPYGIQQPAVSAQLLKLEEELNVKLFQRRPFLLTEAGKTLFEFIEPFFSKLPRIASQLKGEEEQHLRLGASQTVLAHYLPILLKQLRKDHPHIRLTLRQVNPSDAETLLLDEQIDLAVSVLHGRPATGLRCIELINTPLALLAHRDAKHASFKTLLKQARNGAIPFPLVSLPPEERISQIFQKQLNKLRVQWDPEIVVNQLALVQSYVAEGFGYGVYAEVPGLRLRKAVRRIALPDFPEVTIGCLHRAYVNPVTQHFMDSAQELVASLRQLRQREAGA